MRKEEAKWQKVLWIVFMLLFSITATAVAAYIYGNSLRDICLLLIVVTAGCAGVVFALIQSDICGVLHYDNGAHYVRFVVTFMILCNYFCTFLRLKATNPNSAAAQRATIRTYGRVFMIIPVVGT